MHAAHWWVQWHHTARLGKVALDCHGFSCARCGVPGQQVPAQQGVPWQRPDAQVVDEHAALRCAGGRHEAWQRARQLDRVWSGRKALAQQVGEARALRGAADAGKLSRGEGANWLWTH